jgi:hypothetical protein
VSIALWYDHHRQEAFLALIEAPAVVTKQIAFNQNKLERNVPFMQLTLYAFALYGGTRFLT